MTKSHAEAITLREKVESLVGEALNVRRDGDRRVSEGAVTVRLAARTIVGAIVGDVEAVSLRFPLTDVMWGGDAGEAVAARWEALLQGVVSLTPKMVDDLILAIYACLPPFDETATARLVHEFQPGSASQVLTHYPRVPGHLRSILGTEDEFLRILGERVDLGR